MSHDQSIWFSFRSIHRKLKIRVIDIVNDDVLNTIRSNPNKIICINRLIIERYITWDIIKDFNFFRKTIFGEITHVYSSHCTGGYLDPNNTRIRCIYNRLTFYPINISKSIVHTCDINCIGKIRKFIISITKSKR